MRIRPTQPSPALLRIDLIVTNIVRKDCKVHPAAPYPTASERIPIHILDRTRQARLRRNFNQLTPILPRLSIPRKWHHSSSP